MNIIRKENDLLPNHHHSNSTSSNSSTTTGNLISIPTKLLTKRYFVPTLISLILILLYFTNNLYNGPTSSNYDRLNDISKDLSNKVPFMDEISPSRLGANDVDWGNVDREIDLNQSLEMRLEDWENSPLDGIETADWVTQSIKTCPATRITPNQNKVQLEQSHLLWSTLSAKKIKELRTEMIAFLRNASLKGKMSKRNWGTGKGIVFTAGNADTFARVLTSLRLLNKHLETHLPVEIFSFPGEIPSDEIRKELEGYGAKFITVENAVKDPTKAKSYHIKATAIIRSSFREVLYLDSDNLPTAGLSPAVDEKSTSTPQSSERKWSDNSGLWESKAYKRLGVMFWQDYWRTGADNPIWAIIGVACRDEWEQEAGQILIDKSLHLDALLLSEWMMDSSRFKFWMNFSDGDKDLFRYSFLALRKRWGVPGRYVGVGAFPSDAMTGFGGHTMLQHDHVGRPLFVHANLLKQIPSGIGPGYAWGKTKSLSLPVNTLTLPSNSSPFLSDSDPNLEDLDVDCDQLANVDLEGNGIKPAEPAVRRRAVMERGMAAFWHGGWISALCIDMSYKDTRTAEDLVQQQAILTSKQSSFSSSTSGSKEAQVERISLAASKLEIDQVKKTLNVTTTSDGLELYWGENSLTVKEWFDDVRLKDFEKVFFEEGGVLSNPGF